VAMTALQRSWKW